jgi:hypothetical protein
MCEGVHPDGITFVCLLSACSHAVLVDEGMRCYALMIEVYMISATLEHYTCMVDLLACAGHLQEAENIIKVMPCRPHVTVDGFAQRLPNSWKCGHGRTHCKGCS